MTIEEKREKLRETLEACGSLAVACSGGVDSSFLLKAAQEALGGRVLALTVDSALIPRRELEDAAALCRSLGVRQKIVSIDALALPQVRENPPERCYYCKRAIFERLKEEAAADGFSHLAEGSNRDDEGDYRPGHRAIRELGVLSPLREAGLGKAEIRQLSRALGLPCWDKPSAACLASRFPYGQALEADRLRAVERAEELLHGLGVRQCRVRVHGKQARIEVPPEEFGRILDSRVWLVDALKQLGFLYVSLDLAGFRSGSMNDVLK